MHIETANFGHTWLSVIVIKEELVAMVFMVFLLEFEEFLYRDKAMVYTSFLYIYEVSS